MPYCLCKPISNLIGVWNSKARLRGYTVHFLGQLATGKKLCCKFEHLYTIPYLELLTFKPK